MKALCALQLARRGRAPRGAERLDYDVAVLAGDIVAPGRLAARWLRDPARFGDKPIVQIAGNHEYYEAVINQELAEMRRQAETHDIQQGLRS